MDKFLAQTKAASSQATAAGNATDEAGKALPPGVVLGKDGKPCRTCTDNAAWKALMRGKSSTKAGDDRSGSSSGSGSGNHSASSSAVGAASLASFASTSTSTSNSTSSSLDSDSTTPTQRTDCPPDVAELGRSSWTLLHSLAATYPSSASTEKQSEMSQFLALFSKLYPCWVCAEDFQGWIKKEPPAVEGWRQLGDWMCRAHNDVNKKLGKKTFDCKLWEERWRSGWKDGSCD